MPSLIQSYEYDIFISYRQKDNKGERWVSTFVSALKEELEATFKEDISIYFDENPHDGLLETHDVSESLKDKLKCLVFIPVISQTYCDPKSFAWQQEFLAFKNQASADSYGLKVKLKNGNVTSRILPVRIHELDESDKATIENEIGTLRPVDFIFKSPGVNRPLSSTDNPDKNLSKTFYKDQVNKVANSVKEIISVCKEPLAKKTKVDLPKAEPAGKRGAYIGIATALLLGAVYLFYHNAFDSKTKTVELEKSIAVLPFEDLSPSKDQQHFSKGIAEEILNRLVQIDGLKVPGWVSSLKLDQEGITMKEVGEKLNVNYVLKGSVRKIENRVKISVQLIGVSDGYHVWSKEFDRNLKDMFALEEEVGVAIAEKLKLTFLQRDKSVTEKVYTQNEEAYDNYLRGTYFWNLRRLKESEKYFKEAVRLDSNFALGYEGLAKTYVISQFFGLSSNESMPKVVRAAQKAIELDSTLAVPYLCLGMKNAIYDWNPTVARKYFLKALELNPKYAPSHYWYGQFLILFGTKEEFPTMISEMKNGVELDPQSSNTYHNLGLAQMYAGEYEEAVKTIKKSMELNPEFKLPSTNLGLCYFALKNIDASKKAFELGDSLKNDQGPAYLVYFYVREGKMKQAQEIFNRLVEVSRSTYVHELSFAIAASFLGQKDLAHSYFKKAIESHDTWLPYYLKYPADMPRLGNLLSDPRNKKLLPPILQQSITN